MATASDNSDKFGTGSLCLKLSLEAINLLSSYSTAQSKVTSPMNIEVSPGSDCNNVSPATSPVLAASRKGRRRVHFSDWFPPESYIADTSQTHLDAASVQDDREPLISIEGSRCPSPPPAEVELKIQNNSDTNGSETPVVEQSRSCWQYYTALWERVTKFPLMLSTLLLILFALACVSCYMGIVCMGQCQVREEIPLLLITSGGSYIIAIVTKLTGEALNKCSNGLSEMFHVPSITGGFISLVIFLAQTFLFNAVMGIPSKKPGPTYCDPVFYLYVLWHNWTVLIFVILLAFVYVPSCHRATESERIFVDSSATVDLGSN